VRDKKTKSATKEKVLKKKQISHPQPSHEPVSGEEKRKFMQAHSKPREDDLPNVMI